jgi:lambda repressor-like predicted transcriptional regulator
VNQGVRDSILARIRLHGKTCGQVARAEGLERAEVEQILLQEMEKAKELMARRAWTEGYRAGQLRPLPPTMARKAA